MVKPWEGGQESNESRSLSGSYSAKGSEHVSEGLLRAPIVLK